MSSYDCVLPIDFDCFQNQLLPAALGVLSGTLIVPEFVSTYVPKPDKDYIDDYYLDGNYVCVPAYVELFKKPLVEWKSSEMIATLAYEEQAKYARESAENKKWILSCWDIIFCDAVKQTCAIELPGEELVDDTHGGYYSRLHGFPEIKLAGAKNGWRFLSGFYDVTWLPSEHVLQYERRRSSPENLFELLEKLFLGVRCLPGLDPSRLSPSWPAYDDISFQGYLTPQEVKDLTIYIPEMRSAAEQTDELFPLFVDRLKRSAEVGAGLITIQCGL